MEPLDFPDIIYTLQALRRQLAGDPTYNKQDSAEIQFSLLFAENAVDMLRPRTADDKPDNGQPVLAAIRAPHLDFEALEVLHFHDGAFHIRLPSPRGGFVMRPLDRRFVTKWWPITAAAARVDEAQLEKQEATHDRN